MPFRATPVLLLLGILAANAPALHAQNSTPEANCRLRKVKAPSAANTKQGALNAARVRVVKGARERVARRAVAAGIAEPKGIFVLRSEKNRSTVKLAAARTNLPEAILEEVAMESADLFASWPEKGTASVFVRLDSLPTRQVPIGEEQSACAPKVLNHREIADAMSQHAVGRPGLVTKSGLSSAVRFVLTRDGEILAPEVYKFSGNSGWDQTALAFAQQLRITPALLEGVPVDVWTTIPLRMIGRGK